MRIGDDMGKASQAKAPQNTREKIAVQRAAARRAEQRRRLLIAGGIVLAVVVLVAAFLVVKLNESAPKALGSATDPQIAQQIASVSAATFNTVGTGNATGLTAMSGQPELTVDGKPEVLYIGGEFCPFCAAERWAVAAALSRFGTLKVPNLIHSSPTDIYANTPTLTFVGSSYTSSYVAFRPVEYYGEEENVYLQQPTQQEMALWKEYGNGVPFLDIANRYLLPTTQYVPGDLAGLTWSQVAADMQNASSTVARDIDGAAYIITAALCKVTSGQPAGVCSSPGVEAAAGSL